MDGKPKKDSHCICLSLILIKSVFLEVFLEEYKYINKYISDYLEISSHDSDKESFDVTIFNSSDTSSFFKVLTILNCFL